MELDDCAFPLLKGIVPTANLDEGFRGVNWALLVGSVPRKAGMERKDLLGINGKIFIGQGKAIAKKRRRDVRILVVGNPCNTNCLIAMHNAPGHPARPLLRHDRASTKTAPKPSSRKRPAWTSPPSATSPSGATIPPRKYPDFYNAKINGQPATGVITDEAWLKGEFITTVQQRGAAIIKARGSSSAASAANAVVDSVRSIITPDARRRLAQRLCLFRRQLRHREGFDLAPSRSAATARNWKSFRACRSMTSAAQKLTPP